MSLANSHVRLVAAAAAAAVASSQHPSAGGSFMRRWRARSPAPAIRRKYATNAWTNHAVAGNKGVGGGGGGGGAGAGAGGGGVEPVPHASSHSSTPTGIPTLLRRRSVKPVRWTARGRLLGERGDRALDGTPRVAAAATTGGEGSAATATPGGNGGEAGGGQEAAEVAAAGATAQEAQQARRIQISGTASATAASAVANTTHLRELRIRDFALVQEQRVRLHPGLNIITGQSGSGKSVLLEAISQLCGAPAREEGIRAGAECAVLQGIFQVGQDKMPAVRAILERYGGGISHAVAATARAKNEEEEEEEEEEDGDGDGDGEEAAASSHEDTTTTSTTTLVIERRLMYVGDERMRSVCRVNDTNMPVKALRALGNLLVDFNGQGAAAALSDENAQMELLDDWAGTSDLRRRFDELAGELAARRAEAAKMIDISDDERRELESLIGSVDDVDPTEGEDGALKAELRRMESSRVAAEACVGVIGLLGGEGGIGGGGGGGGGVRQDLGEAAFQVKGLLGSAQRAAAKEQEDDDAVEEEDEEEDELAAAVEGLREAVSMCREAEGLVANAQARVAEYATALRADPRRREECTSRLRELDRLCRTIGVRTASQARAAADMARQRLDAADNYEDTREVIAEAVAKAERAIAEAGLELAVARRDAAGALRGDVTDALASLAMEGSRFDVSLTWEEAAARRRRRRQGHSSSSSSSSSGGDADDYYGHEEEEDLEDDEEEEDLDDSSFSSSASAAARGAPAVRVPGAGDVGEKDGANFRVRDGGLDRVTFLLAAGPNEPLRSMGAIASGGEKARLMLALKLAPAMRAEVKKAKAEDEPSSSKTSETSETSEMENDDDDDHHRGEVPGGGGVSVFDELDSGVGARIGARIGVALHRLSSKGGQQVLCVTHLPQVAAYGDVHLRISKGAAGAAGAAMGDDDGGRGGLRSEDDDDDEDNAGAETFPPRTTINIEMLEGEEARVEEISAMLGLGEIEGRLSATRLRWSATRGGESQ